MRFQDVSLGEALDTVLTAAFDVRVPEVDPPAPLPLPGEMSLGELVDALKGVAGKGGLTAVAAMAGVDRRTLQRLASGKHSKPSPATLDKLRAAWKDQRSRVASDQKRAHRAAEAARQSAIAQARSAVRNRLQAAGGTLRLEGTIAISSDERPGRRLNLSSWFSSESRRDIIDAWDGGGAADADAAFHVALNTDYVTGGAMSVLDVQELTW